MFKVTWGNFIHLKISNTWGIPVQMLVCDHRGPIWGNLIFLDNYACRRYKKSSTNSICSLKSPWYCLLELNYIQNEKVRKTTRKILDKTKNDVTFLTHILLKREI